MEDCPSPRCDSLRDLPGIPHEEFAYHVQLLEDAGLIEAIDASSFSGIDWIPISITHEGHEFLDSVRNDNLWSKTKEKALSVAGTLSIEALKLAVNALLKAHLAWFFKKDQLCLVRPSKGHGFSRAINAHPTLRL